jgi:hypothetical protein
MGRLVVVGKGMTVPGETLAAELGATAGHVAAGQTEPEVGFEVAFVADVQGDRLGGGGLVEEEDVFAWLEVEGESLDVGLFGHCLRCEEGRDDFGKLPRRQYTRKIKEGGEGGRVEGIYISVIIGDVGLTILTKDFGMEVKPFTLRLLRHNLQFRQLLGSLLVRLDLGRPPNVTDEGMPGVFVVQCLVIVLGGGGVMAGTVEAGQTDVDAVLQILKSHQFPREWGGKQERGFTWESKH